MAGAESWQKAPAGKAKRCDLRRSVVLVGMMGSGKTAVGRVLAARLGVPFLDSDAAIEEAAHATIAEIFRPGRRALLPRPRGRGAGEAAVRPAAVVSTGGGAFMAERTAAPLPRRAWRCGSTPDLDTLWERVRHKDTRPLLRTPDPKGTLAALYDKRVPVYRLADLSMRAEPGYSVEETASRAARCPRYPPRHPGVRMTVRTRLSPGGPAGPGLRHPYRGQGCWAVRRAAGPSCGGPGLPS
jgi:shikimate kinase